MSQRHKKPENEAAKESQQEFHAASDDGVLAGLRAQIDEADRQILAALNRRMRVCEEIALVKSRHDIPMMQPGRVGQVQANVARAAGALGLPENFVRRLYQLIIDETCRIEDELMGDGSTGGIAANAPAPSHVIGIDHVAVAVSDLEQAISSLRDHYGFSVIERRDVEGTVSGMTSATMRAGDASIVLCQGTSPQSNVSRYIENVGQGVQHVALRVEGHETLVAELTAMGADMLTGIIHAPGLNQTFTRRDNATGLQFEFVSRNEHTGFEDSNVRELFEAMEREDVW